MKIETKKISPALAAVLLETNNHNRKADTGHIASMAHHMKNGDWKQNGDTIRVSKSGTLLDGQHRLLALIEANKSFDFIVVSELDDEVFDVIDTGKTRSSNDMFSISRVANGNTISGTIRAIISYDNGVYADGGERGRNKHKAPFLILEKYNTCPEYYQDLHKKTSLWYKYNRALAPSEYGLIYHALCKINSIHAEEFITLLSTGAGLAMDNPILVLRNKLAEYKSSKLRPSLKLKLQIIFTAWNHWRKGGTLKFLRITGDTVVKPI